MYFYIEPLRYIFDEKWNLINSVENMGNFDRNYPYRDAIKSDFSLCLNIKEPNRWSAEEPNLYNLIIQFYQLLFQDISL